MKDRDGSSDVLKTVFLSYIETVQIWEKLSFSKGHITRFFYVGYLCTIGTVPAQSFDGYGTVGPAAGAVVR